MRVRALTRIRKRKSWEGRRKCKMPKVGAWGEVVQLKTIRQLFHNRGFLGNLSRDLRLSEFSAAAYGPLHGLSRNRSRQLLLAE